MAKGAASVTDRVSAAKMVEGNKDKRIAAVRIKESNFCVVHKCSIYDKRMDFPRTAYSCFRW